MIGRWIAVRAAGVNLSFSQVVGMVLRRTFSDELALALIASEKGALGIDVSTLESHFLCGGNVLSVVRTASALKMGDEPFSLQRIMALDLAKKNADEVFKVWTTVREKHKDFSWEEIVDRAISGEDVVQRGQEGALAPLAALTEWSVRIEYNNLSVSEVKQILQAADRSANLSVRRPNGEQWESTSVVSHSL